MKVQSGRAPPLRSKTPSSHRGPRLRPGWLRHPRVLSLPLLPSGPDGVRRPELRRSRLSTPFAAARLKTQTSAREFGPAKADCRCRVPPAPHLARPNAILPGAWRQRPMRLEKVAPRPLSATADHLTRGLETATDAARESSTAPT